jgi:PAS domain S-box-containing protein
MLADGVPFAYAFLDCELRFRFINRAYGELYHRDFEEVEGVCITDLVDDSEFARVVDVMGRALEGESVTVDAEGHRGSTVGRQIRYRLEPARDPETQEIIGVLFQTTDITDLTELTSRLERKQEELLRSNADLEQFAYVASHDLKAPLRAISAIVGWLREDLAEIENEDVNENLDLLAQRTSRLSRLLDDLLAYSRAGRQSGDVKVVDLGELATEVAQLHIHDDQFEVTVAEDMPTVMANPTPLEQVLRNLISNAVKHHPGEAGHIWVSGKASEHELEVTVADDGEGIPEEYADRVFKMFQTLKPRDEKEGSGMGLAIVARIIQLHGGRVWFEPREEGPGAVFKFTWKLGEATEVEGEIDEG